MFEIRMQLKMAVMSEVRYCRLYKMQIIIKAHIPWFPTLLFVEIDNFGLLLGLVLLLVATPTELFAVSVVTAKLEPFVVSALSS